MSDTSTEFCGRLADHCVLGRKALREEFPSGQAILDDCAATLRALAAERDALRAALEKTWAVLEQIESHRRLCMQYDEENGHVPRTFDEEDLRIMEIAARAAMKEIERAITDKPRRFAE
jgi:hypothetical protein